jgi:hypothetical protein
MQARAIRVRLAGWSTPKITPGVAAPAPANKAKRANESGPDSEISCNADRAGPSLVFVEEKALLVLRSGDNG